MQIASHQLVVAALFAVVVVMTGTSGAENRPDGSVSWPPLTWAPPEGYEGFVPFTIPAGGGRIELPSSSADYLIAAPEVITGPVTLRGGRHVVWIGGHIRIDRSTTVERPSPTDRRALMIVDAADGSSVDREVHIEGLLIDGDDLAEGINTRCIRAQVTIQNTRIELVMLRGCDDRDGTNGYRVSHPDIIQTWGSQRGLRVDGLTGSSNYQGIFLKEDLRDRRRLPAWLRRVNLAAVELPDEADPSFKHAGHRMISIYPNNAGQLFIENGTVFVRHHPNSGRTGEGPLGGRFHKSVYRDMETNQLVADPAPGTATLAGALGHHSPLLAEDEIGVYAYWPDTFTVNVNGRPAVRNWDGSGPGRIYGGEPAGGDYVPRAAVGIGYVSPGYGPQRAVFRP
jgi:hypothetical protein